MSGIPTGWGIPGVPMLDQASAAARTAAWREAQPQWIYERVERSPEWLAARDAFAEIWEELRDAGLAAGYLEQPPCYECGGEVIVTTDTYTRERRPNPLAEPPEAP